MSSQDTLDTTATGDSLFLCQINLKKKQWYRFFFQRHSIDILHKGTRSELVMYVFIQQRALFRQIKTRSLRNHQTEETKWCNCSCRIFQILWFRMVTEVVWAFSINPTRMETLYLLRSYRQQFFNSCKILSSFFYNYFLCLYWFTLLHCYCIHVFCLFIFYLILL